MHAARGMSICRWLALSPPINSLALSPPFPSPAAPSRLVRLLFWHRKTRAKAASGPPHPARLERRAGLGLAGLVSRAPAPANRASPGRSDRTTCLPARSQGLLACGGGLEVRSSQAGALMGLHTLVLFSSLEHVGSRCNALRWFS